LELTDCDSNKHSPPDLPIVSLQKLSVTNLFEITPVPGPPVIDLLKERSCFGRLVRVSVSDDGAMGIWIAAGVHWTGKSFRLFHSKSSLGSPHLRW